MAASRRLHKELEEIRKSGMKNFRNIQVDESNILTWQGLIVPVSGLILVIDSWLHNSLM
ncbi:unnamed protein product [Oncorhynchus mykiss]|uniref:UBC core domain-containing protein n=1 Tax=Oncorhynchus mykiss TaxID=8022 RepID=A0A060Y3M8_ONCMY|nr:unnamed protein product [Oncorhynchus mykiss]